MKTYEDIFSETIPSITPATLVFEALEILNDAKIAHICLIDDDNKWLGLVSESDLLNSYDDGLPAMDFAMKVADLHCHEKLSIYDVITFMKLHNVSIAPFVDKSNNYLGSASYESILDFLSSNTSYKDQGAVLELSCAPMQYSLSAISKVVEAEGNQVLLMHTNITEADEMKVTIKVNSLHVSAIIEALERMDYLVLNTYNDETNEEFLQDRFDGLMKYLNI
jgi:acetoin utilization protein AcuB